jgi:hypothetical protein
MGFVNCLLTVTENSFCSGLAELSKEQTYRDFWLSDDSELKLKLGESASGMEVQYCKLLGVASEPNS